MGQQKKWLFVSLGLLFLNIGLFTYLLYMGPPLPFYRQGTQVGITVKPVQVTEETIIYLQDGYDICYGAHLSCSEPIILKGIQRQELNGLSFSEITNLYSQQDNWTVDADSQGTSVLIYRIKEGLCPEHNSYYHFAETSGRLVAYHGPAAVGKRAGIALDTELLVDALPEMFANKARLGQWEFKSWDELQAVVDTLDES